MGCGCCSKRGCLSCVWGGDGGGCVCVWGGGGGGRGAARPNAAASGWQGACSAAPPAGQACCSFTPARSACFPCTNSFWVPRSGLPRRSCWGSAGTTASGCGGTHCRGWPSCWLPTRVRAHIHPTLRLRACTAHRTVCLRRCSHAPRCAVMRKGRSHPLLPFCHHHRNNKRTPNSAHRC
jgi:hypothetical protein